MSQDWDAGYIAGLRDAILQRAQMVGRATVEVVLEIHAAPDAAALKAIRDRLFGTSRSLPAPAVTQRRPSAAAVAAQTSAREVALATGKAVMHRGHAVWADDTGACHPECRCQDPPEPRTPEQAALAEAAEAAWAADPEGYAASLATGPTGPVEVAYRPRGVR